MAMTPMPTPAPSRTMSQVDFDAAAALHIAALPAFITEANALQTDVNAKQVTASAAAVTATEQVTLAADQVALATTQAGLADADAIATAADRVQTGLDRTQTGLDKVAAAASAASAAAIAGAFVGTSASSLLIAIASKIFETQAGEQYSTGIWMTAVSAANPANWMFGEVTSYSGTTLVIDVQAVGGSGTYGDWNLSLAGPRGAVGATGATGSVALTGTATGTVDLLTGANIASAATINLDTATGNRVHITGTTPITAVTLTRGPRTVIFDGILTLTHHATNNKLPGSANITTAAGDVAVYEGDGTTVRCVAYTKASGLPVVAASAGAPIATYTPSGASTLDIEPPFSATYDKYLISIEGLTVSSNGASLQGRVKLSGVYDTGANYNYWVESADSASATSSVSSATGAAYLLIAGGLGNAAGNAANIDIVVTNPLNANTCKYLHWKGVGGVSSLTAKNANGIGANIASALALTGLRLYLSDGTFSGTVRVYGIPKT